MILIADLINNTVSLFHYKGQYEFLCRAMCSLFRERLDLPIDEDHDDHLYENVVPRTPSSDSDSEMTPQSPVFFDKKDKVVAPKIEHKNNTGI